MERTLYFSRSSTWNVSVWFGRLRYFRDSKRTLGERSAHDHAAHAGGGIEVLLARLAARAVKVGVDLGHRTGIVDVGGWMVGIVVVAGSSREVRAQSSKLLLNLRAAAVWTAVSPKQLVLGGGCMKVGLGTGAARRELKVEDRKSRCGYECSGVCIDVH
jgi:hypothetical protein